MSTFDNFLHNYLMTGEWDLSLLSATSTDSEYFSDETYACCAECKYHDHEQDKYIALQDVLKAQKAHGLDGR